MGGIISRKKDQSGSQGAHQGGGKAGGGAHGTPPPPAPHISQGTPHKNRPPSLRATTVDNHEFLSPLAAKAANEVLLVTESPSVRNFTEQLLEMQNAEGEDHGFQELEGVDEDEDEIEAETSLATLEEEFNHSLSSAEIRIIGSVKRWRRGNLLGSGSYGKVFMAMNTDTGEIFVVKQVPFQGNGGGEGWGGDVSEGTKQLEMEIALLGTLHHPNIVKYLGTERNNVTNELSIFLEHCPGGSVAELVSRFGKLDESVIRKYTREVLEGLIYLHDKGIIHRDIKGQNILVDNHGVCKLADFGASRHMQSQESAQNMSFKGTPVFMSPEVIRDQRYSKKSDIWSVGCTVLQMASGNPPFSEFSNHIAALFHITASTDPPPVPDDLSEGLRSFALLCFERDVKKALPPLEPPNPETAYLPLRCRSHTITHSLQPAHTITHTHHTYTQSHNHTITQSHTHTRVMYIAHNHTLATSFET
jgi:serine/threonine protein kinase